MSGTSNRLTVGFQGVGIRFSSDATEPIMRLRRIFHHFRAPVPDRIVGEIRVSANGDGYAAEGAGGAYGGTGDLQAVVRWAQYHAIDQFIRARTDLIWLHGAAAARGGEAIVLTGPRGRGKSTLVTGLWNRGWSYLTDDILPLDPRTQTLVPFPQMPAARRDLGHDIDEARLHEVSKDETWIDERVQATDVPVAAIVEPRWIREEATTLTDMSAGEAVLALLEGCWNFDGSGETAVASLARFVTGTPAFRLVWSDAVHAVDLLDTALK